MYAAFSASESEANLCPGFFRSSFDVKNRFNEKFEALPVIVNPLVKNKNKSFNEEQLKCCLLTERLSNGEARKKWK